MRPQTAIVGVGATPYYFRGESAPQTLYELIGKAILAAVGDAGLAITDVDGLAFYASGGEPRWHLVASSRAVRAWASLRIDRPAPHACVWDETRSFRRSRDVVTTEC